MDTLLVDYYKKEVASYDASKPGPSLAKVKAAILSLTDLKQLHVAKLIGTKYSVYKAQRYRQDYKKLEDFHRKNFATHFVNELISYTRKYFGKGPGLAHGPDLYLFSDIVIFSDELLDTILQRIATSAEVSGMLKESDALRSTFLNDVLLLIMNIRGGIIDVDRSGGWKVLDKEIICEKNPGFTLLSLAGRFEGSDMNLGLWLGYLIRKSWGANPETVKIGLQAFLKSVEEHL